MPKVVDYSKWADIDVSDDDEDGPANAKAAKDAKASSRCCSASLDWGHVERDVHLVGSRPTEGGGWCCLLGGQWVGFRRQRDHFRGGRCLPPVVVVVSAPPDRAGYGRSFSHSHL